jgi:Uma2 family endonuclease
MRMSLCLWIDATRWEGAMTARIKTDWTRPDYPDWDRRTNAMPDQHRYVLDATVRALQEYFATDPMVYVSGNTPLFFMRKGRRVHVIPDVYVVKGVKKQRRNGFRTWEEGKGPDLVLELSSRSSCHEDALWKFGLYQDTLGVREYVLFDPLGDCLEPRLQGYHLFGGCYGPIKVERGGLTSNVLGLELKANGPDLRFLPRRNGGK